MLGLALLPGRDLVVPAAGRGVGEAGDLETDRGEEPFCLRGVAVKEEADPSDGFSRWVSVGGV